MIVAEQQSPTSVSKATEFKDENPMEAPQQNGPVDQDQDHSGTGTVGQDAVLLSPHVSRVCRGSAPHAAALADAR